MVFLNVPFHIDSMIATLEHLRGADVALRILYFYEGIRDIEHISWIYYMLGTLCSVFCTENYKFRLSGLLAQSLAFFLSFFF